MFGQVQNNPLPSCHSLQRPLCSLKSIDFLWTWMRDQVFGWTAQRARWLSIMFHPCCTSAHTGREWWNPRQDAFFLLQVEPVHGIRILCKYTWEGRRRWKCPSGGAAMSFRNVRIEVMCHTIAIYSYFWPKQACISCVVAIQYAIKRWKITKASKRERGISKASLANYDFFLDHPVMVSIF